MIIRLATPRDKRRVLNLLDEFSSYLKSKHVPSQVGGAIFDEIIQRDDIKIFIAEENNLLLGTATLYLLPIIRHGWRSGHIEDFFITSSARSNGIGTKIFLVIKKYCQENDLKVIKLGSGNELTEAHRFYEKHGGKSTERFFRFDIE